MPLLEHDLIAGRGFPDFRRRRVGVRVAHEKQALRGIAQHASGENVRKRVRCHHPTGEGVDRFLARNRIHDLATREDIRSHLLEQLQLRMVARGVSRQRVVDGGDLHAEPADINGNIADKPVEAHFPEHRQHLLRFAQREDRDRHRAALFDRALDRAAEALLFPGAAESHRRGRIAPRGLHDQHIDPVFRKIRAAHDRLVFEIHIAGVENRFSLVPDHHTGGAQNVPGMVEFKGHLVVVHAGLPGEVVALAQAATHPGLHAEIHAPVRVERILHEVQLVALARHHAHRVVHHDLGDVRRGLREENRALRFPASQHGQRTDVVLMRMGDDDRVHRPLRHLGKIRRRSEPVDLGIGTGVEDDVFPANAEPIGIRADSQMAREVDKIHRRGRCALKRITSIQKMPPQSGQRTLFCGVALEPVAPGRFSGVYKTSPANPPGKPFPVPSPPQNPNPQATLNRQFY